MRFATISVVLLVSPEWSWTPEFPASPFLRNLWVEPFLMLEKEVTW
ncbi:MAG: hypothetical protein JSW52_11540 [Candidatus Coatesbacteria bacterium]|nr:MAG: hypothetical protein JSW52_11540 [Candidatus Coatesbacteria bacterium]